MPRRRQPGPHATFLRRWVRPLAVLAAVAGGGAWAAPQEAPRSQQQPSVDPQASTQLQKMSDFLASQQQFSVQVDGSTEVVLKAGQKVEFDYSSDVRVQRPDKLRSDRHGELANLSFYYDGRSFALFGKNQHYYATADAPPNLDEAIDAAREQLGIEAPAADLLYSNPAKVLMEDVVSGMYLGSNDIHGITCHHLAFRGNETDWQIWIQDGPQPVPLKFVIVSKKVQGEPEFTAELSQWNFSPNLSDAVFHFTPPSDAKRIEFRSQQPSPGTQGGRK